jgi:hypothetical protein
MLAGLFKRRYLASLRDFTLFYDDFRWYGDPGAPTAFYFVPGIDGCPGQIRFVLPVLQRRFGHDIHVRCLYLPEFSTEQPIWDKFSIANVERKRERILEDLEDLARRHERIFVIASSNGFYDFLYAHGDLPAPIREKTTLLWVAVAPDRFRPSPWETVFYRLNGFEHNGHAWCAVPNNNLFRWLNPEATTSHTWRSRTQRKVFFKNDLESRLSLLGMQWSYLSLGCFNECLEHAISRSTYPIQIPTHILVATNDGYWQGRPTSDIDDLLDKYLGNKRVLKKHASHLWVLVPDNLTEFLADVD